MNAVESITFYTTFLHFCRRLGILGRMSKRKQIFQHTLRLPMPLYKRIVERAEKNYRTVSGEICALIDLGMAQSEDTESKTRR